MISVVSLSVASVSVFVSRKNNDSLSSVSKTVAAIPKSNVLGQQISVSQEYSVVIDSAKETDNGKTLAVSVTVSNISDHVVQLAPYMQLKLIGLYSGKFGEPSITGDRTVFAGGPLAAGTKTSGTVYYAVLQDEQSEIRFYPDVKASSYLKLPIVETKDSEAVGDSVNDDKTTENQKPESVKKEDE